MSSEPAWRDGSELDTYEVSREVVLEPFAGIS